MVDGSFSNLAEVVLPSWQAVNREVVQVFFFY